VTEGSSSTSARPPSSSGANPESGTVMVQCERCGETVAGYWCEDPDELKYLCAPHTCVIGIPPSHLSFGFTVKVHGSLRPE